MLVPALLLPGEDNKELWKAHDASELVKLYQGPSLPALIDTGSADNFLEVQVSFRDDVLTLLLQWL